MPGVIILVLILLNTPLLYVRKMAVDNQVERL